MTKKCCIPTCKLESDQPEGRNLTFHTVPIDMREKWTEILQTKFSIDLKKYSYICCKHFDPICFYYTNLRLNKRLKKGSCPILFEDKYEKLNTEKSLEDDQSTAIIETCNHEENDVTVEPPVTPACSLTDDTSTNQQQINDSSINTSDKLVNYNQRKSILSMNVDSVNITEEAKKIINLAKAEVIKLRRRNHQLQMRLYRSRKGVKNATSLLSHIKKREFIYEDLHEKLQKSSYKHWPINKHCGNV